MYRPTLGRFASRDPLGANSVDILYDNDWLGDKLTSMRGAFRDGFKPGFTDYSYARNNPNSFTDPSGLVCRHADPPTNVIPPEDVYFPWQVWRPQPQRGYLLHIGPPFPNVFKDATCDGCTMDVEIVARTYRYYRFKNDRFIGHQGTPIGVSNDPRDFFRLVVVTVCKTNVKCCGVDRPDEREVVVSEPLSRDSVGVFIRVHPHGIEPVAAQFKSDDPCTFAVDAVSYIQSNVRAGPIDPGRLHDKSLFTQGLATCSEKRRFELAV